MLFIVFANSQTAIHAFGAMNNVMEAKDDLPIKTEVMQCRGEGACKAAPKVRKIEHAGHGAAHMEHTERISVSMG